VQPGDVQALIADEDQDGRGPDGLDSDVAAGAADDRFPQPALACLAGQALGHGQGAIAVEMTRNEPIAFGSAERLGEDLVRDPIQSFVKVLVSPSLDR